MARDVTKRAKDTNVSISAKLEANGVKVNAASRFASALDRLGANLAEFASIPLEGWNQHARGKRAIVGLAYDKIASILEAETEEAKAIAISVLDKQFRYQTNVNATAGEAANALIEMSQDAASSPADDEASVIDDDWLNFFEGYAEKASSERMRQHWGRVLAREALKPGSFSLSTMRIMSELDGTVATSFEEILHLRVSAGQIFKDRDISGEKFEKYALLEQIGLIYGVSAMVTAKIVEMPTGEGFFTGEKHALRVTGIRPNRFDMVGDKNAISVDIITLTRSGLEVASILNVDSEMDAMRKLGKSLLSRVSTVELIRTYIDGDGRKKGDTIEEIG